MASWRYCFDKINEEYDVVMKKKQALNSLVNSGKISQSTFDLFNKEMDEAIAEIEKQKSALLEKMNAKIKEIEEHIKVLERLLANLEIQHAGGEVDEEAYQREIALLYIGLDNARQELDLMKETINKITNIPKVSESVVVPEKVETKVPESTENIEAVKLEATEVPVKNETQELGETSQEAVMPQETTQAETPPAETETCQTETAPLETSQAETPREEANTEN
ncbi:MAG: CdvA-like protein [Candidatus Bathyarchaeales archaeon]